MAGRWSLYLPLLLVCGVLGMRLLADAHGGGLLAVRDPDLALKRLAWPSSLLLLAAVLLRAVFQSVEVWGTIEGLTIENLRVLALESRWGGRWRWQFGAAALLAVGSLTAFRLPIMGRALTVVGVLGMAAALPMTGHAYGDNLAWTAQSVHVLGAGLWIGTLIVVLLLPFCLGSPTGPEASSVRRYWLSAFAPVATVGVVLLTASGALLGMRYLAAWDALWSEPYGRTLLMKIGLSLGALACGGLNHLALRRRPDWHTASLPRTVGVEVGFAILVLTATGVLASTAQPEMH